jgi:hypothetical protein
MTRTPYRHLLLLLREADPRAAMIVAAVDGVAFGGAVLAHDVFRSLSKTHPTAFEAAALNAFDTFPGWLVGALFLQAGLSILYGIGTGRERAVRWGALGLLTMWTYAWVTLPVAQAAAGSWLPTGWARYTVPLVVSWWIYARSPSAARLSLFGPLLRAPRVLLPVVLLVPPIVAIEIALPSDLTLTALISVAVAVLTLAAKTLAERFKTRTDYAAATLQSTTAKETLLWGIAKEEIGRLTGDLDKLRGQFSEFLLVREDQDQFCRSHCPTYQERPKG